MIIFIMIHALLFAIEDSLSKPSLDEAPVDDLVCWL